MIFNPGQGSNDLIPINEITVLLFAVLQDTAGTDRLIIDLNNMDETAKNNTVSYTVAQLYNQLAEKYNWPLAQAIRLRAAINHQFVTFNTPIKVGDIVAFIPAVSGG